MKSTEDAQWVFNNETIMDQVVGPTLTTTINGTT